jgi:hypothetical protein
MDKNNTASDSGENRPAQKTEKAELIFSKDGSQISVGAQFRYEDGQVKEQVEVFERLLALAELPARNEWPKILAVSNENGMPSIWRRSRASTLENSAVALLTALAFASEKQQIKLLKDFFRVHGFKTGFRGRSHVHPTESTDVARGIQIDRMMARLSDGFRIAKVTKETVRSGDVKERTLFQLKNMGHDEQEIEAIIKGRTLQDAAYRLYHQTVGKQENIDLKAIRNSFARFKKLRRLTSAQSLP